MGRRLALSFLALVAICLTGVNAQGQTQNNLPNPNDPTDGPKPWGCKRTDHTFEPGEEFLVESIFNVQSKEECCTRCYMRNKRLTADERRCDSWTYREETDVCRGRCNLWEVAAGDHAQLTDKSGTTYGVTVTEVIIDVDGNLVPMCPQAVFEDEEPCLCKVDCNHGEVCGDCAWWRQSNNEQDASHVGCTNRLVQHCVCDHFDGCCNAQYSRMCVDIAYNKCGLPLYCFDCDYANGGCPPGTTCHIETPNEPAETPTGGYTVCHCPDPGFLGSGLNFGGPNEVCQII